MNIVSSNFVPKVHAFIAWWNQADMMWIILGVIIGVVGIGFYFLPTIVARNRKHNNALAIFILNFFSAATAGNKGRCQNVNLTSKGR
jgi:hypothetical protein